MFSDQVTTEQNYYSGITTSYKSYLKKSNDLSHDKLSLISEHYFSEQKHKLFEFLPTRVELDLNGWNDIDIFSYGS